MSRLSVQGFFWGVGVVWGQATQLRLGSGSVRPCKRRCVLRDLLCCSLLPLCLVPSVVLALPFSVPFAVRQQDCGSCSRLPIGRMLYDSRTRACLGPAGAPLAPPSISPPLALVRPPGQVSQHVIAPRGFGFGRGSRLVPSPPRNPGTPLRLQQQTLNTKARIDLRQTVILYNTSRPASVFAAMSFLIQACTPCAALPSICQLI